MAWYALEALDEALEETKELLFPFDWKVWAKIALLVFFTGGFNFPSGGNYTPTTDTDSQFDGADQFSGSSSPGVIADVGSSLTGMASAPAFGPGMYAFMFVILIIVLAFLLVASIFEFVYYQSLLDTEVVIKKNFSEHAGKGIHLFGFRLGLMLIGLLGAALLIGAAYQSVNLFLMLLVVAIPAIIVFAVFSHLTNQFIPLVMIEHGVGIIEAWKLFYETLQTEWKQVAAYLAVWFVLSIAVGIAVLLAALVFLIPAIPVAIAVVMLQLSGVAVFALIIVGAILFFATILYFLQVPAQTYLRYYIINVYRHLTA